MEELTPSSMESKMRFAANIPGGDDDDDDDDDGELFKRG